MKEECLGKFDPRSTDSSYPMNESKAIAAVWEHIGADATDDAGHGEFTRH
jgi:hypothetical protein